MDGIFKEVVGLHLNRAAGKPTTNYEAVVYVDGLAASVLKVHSLTHHRDYSESCFETLFLTAAMTTSECRTIISNGHGNVYVKLITYIGGKAQQPVTYRGIARVTGDPNVEAGTTNLAAADDISLSVVTFELMQLAAWELRIYQFGGIFSETTPLELVRYLLAKTRLEEKLSDKDAIASIVYDEESQKPYRTIMIPDGTPYLGVFDYIQNRYGVYGKGLGVYLHKQSWHVFRPWDADKFAVAPDRLVIYNVPQEQMALPDNTYTVDGETVSIAVTGNVQHQDDRDVTALNVGTGFRLGSVRALELRMTSLDTGGVVSETTPGDVVSASNPNPHRSGLVNAPVLTQRFKDDDKSIVSEFIKNSGSIVKVRWENSVNGILKPGMGVKFHYPLGNSVVARYGTLIGEVYHEAIDGDNLSSDRYNSVSELTIWLAH